MREPPSTPVLDVLGLPLRGSRLIEASAGTGKTWTIAALYLRLVLGLGDVVQAEGRPLLPHEILVMTFTRAATRELVERIRQRLVDTEAVLRGRRTPSPDDTFVQGLLQAYPDESARATAAWRLAQAAQHMDDAAIHTLDAWCQRVLREHAALDADREAFEVMGDEAAIREQATLDVWRQQVYPMRGDALAQLLAVWPGVQAMADAVKPLLDSSGAAGAAVPSFDERCRAQVADCRARADVWVRKAEDFRLALTRLLERKVFHGSKLKRVSVDGWLAKLAAWARDGAQAPMPLTTAARERLVPAGLAASLRDAGNADALPPEATDFEDLLAAHDASAAAHRRQLLMDAARLVAARMAQLKVQARRFGHADLLQQLDAALDAGLQGERATALREQLLARYPAVMVDEFQDTSPLQVRVLDRLYRVADNDASRLLLMIGDPKQSIYAFRGADIHGYLRVRAATQGRHHALDVNHRSSSAVVGVVNTLFVRAEQRLPAGAFDFGVAAALPADPSPLSPASAGTDAALPFHAVRARGRDECWVRGGVPAPALELVFDAEPTGVGLSRRRQAQRAAEALVRLLDDPGAGFEPADGQRRRLQPGDVAVLVRNHVEAAAVRREMARRGLPSVFLSERDSIFDSPEAADVLRLLQAVAAPRDARLARAALGSALFDADEAERLRLADDEGHFERQGEQLHALHEVWRQRGVLAVIRQAVQRWQLGARWMRHADAERRMTNVLHLAELLQAESLVAPGMTALLRWLAHQVGLDSGSREADDEAVLRLESDADRVQVVTIHKSKGLEYPVVFLPFAAHARTEHRSAAVTWQPGDNGRVPVLDGDDQARDASERERLREDIRLLYVALTRARHALWLGVDVVQRRDRSLLWPHTALGHLLADGAAATVEALRVGLQDWAGAAGGDVQVIEASHAGLDGRTAWQGRPAPAGRTAAVRRFTALLDQRWTISSYSALVRDRAAAPLLQRDPSLLRAADESRPAGQLGDDDAAQASDWRATMAGDDIPAAVASGAGVVGEAGADVQARDGRVVPEGAEAAADAMHRFPRGPQAGNLLHDQLEWLAGEGFALARRPGLRQAVQRRAERAGWGAWAPALAGWLEAICTTRLPPWDAALCELEAPLAEMEFWLPSDGLSVQRIDEHCRAQILSGRERPALAPRELRGMLMGFADLCVAHRGRHWVLDYKSNALGEDDGAYRPEAMRQAVLDHRYDVQAALYLLCMHRLLKARQGDAYQPARDLGGAIFFFLRGVRAEGAGCLHLDVPPALLKSLDGLLPVPAIAGARR